MPEGFREACETDPETIASGVLAEADAGACALAGKADLAEDGFVDACSALVHAASWVVWLRSPTAQPLSPQVRAKLRPWFGDLVDTARVSWNAGLLGRWRVLGHDIVFDADTVAQTFGDLIYVRHPPASDNETIALIGHELGHTAQYREHGGIDGFARAYCRAFYDAGMSYRQNALEVEAYDLQHEIRRCLDGGC